MVRNTCLRVCIYVYIKMRTILKSVSVISIAMATNAEIDVSDISKKVIENVVTGLGFKDHKIVITSGAAKGDNYMGEIFKIKVTGLKSDGKEDTAYLIMKKAPTTPLLREHLSVRLLYLREKFVYTRMLPILNQIQEEHNLSQEDRFSYAKFYDCVEDEMEEMLLLKDISVDGYRMHERLHSFDYDHVSLAIKNLARFHSTSIVLKAKNRELFDEIVSKATKMSDFTNNQDMWIDGSIKMVERICHNKDYKDQIIEALKKVVHEMNGLLDGDVTAPYNIICHGDCWNNNFLFKYENDKVVGMTMVDWQIMRASTPVSDIAYMLFTGTDQSIRRKHYKDLLDLYYETLSANVAKMGVDINEYYPERIYRQHIKDHMNYGLMMGLGLLPLTLSNRGETPELEEIFDQFMGGGSDTMNMNLSKYCVERILEVMEDCIEFGAI